jgi:hypothetical protein
MPHVRRSPSSSARKGRVDDPRRLTRSRRHATRRRFYTRVDVESPVGAGLEDATWDLALSILPQAWWDRRTAELAAAARTRRPIPAAER